MEVLATGVNNKRICLLFMFCLLIDIGGGFGVKYISFAIMTAYLLANLLKGSIRLPQNFLVIEGALFVLLPMLSVFYSAVFYSVPLSKGFGEVLVFGTWAIYLLLIQATSKETLIVYLKKIGLFCSLVVIFTFLLIVFLKNTGQYTLIYRIATISWDYRFGYLGVTSSQLGSTPIVYYRWSMILIPISVLFFNRKHFLLLFTATILTLSTGIIFFTLVGILVYLIASFVKKDKGRIRLKVKHLLAAVLVLSGAITATQFFDVWVLFSKFSTESASTLTKLGHIESTFDEILQSGPAFLFESGLGTQFYSVGINDYTSEIEVSHLNLIRQFGIIYSILFFVYVLATALKAMKLDDNGRKLGAGLLAFFIAAGTNPLLLSPIFLLMLIFTKAYITLSLKESRSILSGALSIPQ